MPASVLAFFHDGPFAWNGLMCFWVPATVFCIQFAANVTMLLRAIGSDAGAHAETVGEPVGAPL